MGHFKIARLTIVSSIHNNDMHVVLFVTTVS